MIEQLPEELIVKIIFYLNIDHFKMLYALNKYFYSFELYKYNIVFHFDYTYNFLENDNKNRLSLHYKKYMKDISKLDIIYDFKHSMDKLIGDYTARDADQLYNIISFKHLENKLYKNLYKIKLGHYLRYIHNNLQNKALIG